VDNLLSRRMVITLWTAFPTLQLQAEAHTAHRLTVAFQGLTDLKGYVT
jgi:hypothetical protein